MKKSICGVDCEKCELNKTCKGCKETNGKPFGNECVVAKCCLSGGFKSCNTCNNNCGLKKQLIKEVNDLKVKDMPQITTLNSLKGDFVNMEFEINNGQKIKLLCDDKIYLANQVEKKNSDRCFGIACDEEYILICEYGENGVDPQIVEYKKRDLKK